MSKGIVLVIDDEEDLIELVRYNLMSLRRKLGKCGKWVETIRGYGYKFRQEY